MNEKLPMQENTSLIEKIKKFFRRLFYKEKFQDIVETNQQVIPEITDAQKENFENSIKAEVKDEYLKEIKKDEFLEKIEKNPNLLYELSNDRLEKLNEYYDDLILQYKEEIAKLKQTG